MTSTSKHRDHLHIDSIRSSYISERRRNLFPSTTSTPVVWTDEDSELGHMSPITNSESDEDVHRTPQRTFSETMSPLKLSPWSQTLKTPHHDTTCNNILEKEQRVLTEKSKSLKRKANSPEKGSKVRTALFPANDHVVALPTKSFYSNQNNENKDRTRRPFRLSVVPTKTSRNNHKTFIKGQINNGVRHKIRKPKLKPIKKVKRLLQNGEILNEYLKDLSELTNKPKRTTIIDVNKENETIKISSITANKNDMVVSLNTLQVPDVSDMSKCQNTPNGNEIIKCQKTSKFGIINEFDEDFEPPRASINNILSVLANESSGNVLTLPTTTILSPISQMCDVTSGLALSSPSSKPDYRKLIKSSRTSKMLSFSCVDKMSDEQQKKLFPVFCKGASSGLQTKDGERGEKRSSCEISGLKRNAKRFKSLGPDQMLLDVGQKRFGLIQCTECNTFYHQGDPNDELQHSNYHSGLQVLRFSGWKNEHVVADYQSKGRIIRILPTDSKIWLKKVKELMTVVNRDLGCYETDSDVIGSHSQVYLYVRNRIIVGCVVVTSPQERGHRILSTDDGVAMCSEESYPIKCGISHIWVGEEYRKQGIASALLDVVKRNYITGHVLSNDDVALTSPTEAGSAFAQKYFKTINYLIYFK